MKHTEESRLRLLRLACRTFIFIGFIAFPGTKSMAQSAPCTGENTITARVVAFDQIIVYNRFGSFDPGGMMFALERDVVAINNGTNPGPGNAQLRRDKRPRPIVLRVHEGECLQVIFKNWLTPNRDDVEGLRFLNVPRRRPYFDARAFFMPIDPQPPFEPDKTVLRIKPNRQVEVIDSTQPPPDNVVDNGDVNLSKDDTPATRYASMHVNGLDLVGDILSDGSNVGKNPSSLVAPGGVRTYKWYAARQGQYLLYSTAATSGGEGDGGQIVHGLFGSVNVEVPGSKWYRSQVTKDQFIAATRKGADGSPVKTPIGQPVIDYEAKFTDGTTPVLNMLQGNEIIYTDLNAIITDSAMALKEDCTDAPPSGTCGYPFREFTVIFHDELETGAPAFPELHQFVFHSVKDGFGINYGAAGLGSELLANRKRVGPAAKCDDCKFEEFFLESWTNGDPALLIRYGAPDPQTLVAKAEEALFPDDPSNVHHSYINDRVRFRNLHAGPKETHVFHLHAHQWLQSPRDQESTYLDSQTISPGAAFTYEINYGGSGNRNLTPGDAIFHCHLYPHFAQGMWELWRNHDVFEDGTRVLPDGELVERGTPIPAIVPIPYVTHKRDDGTIVQAGMPLMPTPDFPGFPFYIAAEKDPVTNKLVAGKRPPQPPLAFDKSPNGQERDGGLPRHIVREALVKDGPAAIQPTVQNDPVHRRVHTLNPDPNLRNFARILTSADVLFFPAEGTADERKASSFHAGIFNPAGTGIVPFRTEYFWPAIGYESFSPTGQPGLFLVNGRPGVSGAPYADPCPDKFKGNGGVIRDTPTRKYRTAWLQGDLVINRARWHDRQARVTMLETEAKSAYYNGFPDKTDPLFFRANSGDCVDYRVTNLVPNFLNLDDFEVYQNTDIIGQHIHLVKFDVTSSDGAGNGWNYESGAFSPTEVQQRIRAIRRRNNCLGKNSGDPKDGQVVVGQIACPVAKVNPFFGGGVDRDGDGMRDLVGAQTLVERWWADPLLNTRNEDRTIRTVFTHDHFSPSGHQHHGLYAGLIVEPMDARWTFLSGQPMGGPVPNFVLRRDGGPTNFAANILTSDQSVNYREFNLEIGDFAIVYTPGLIPVNPPNHVERDQPIVIGSPNSRHPERHPTPEAISAADPGTSVINYKNEPIPLRIGRFSPSQGHFVQRPGKRGDLAYAFSSSIHLRDPFTPILRAYVGDRVVIRLLQGAQEEQHMINVHGHRWLFEPGTPRPFDPFPTGPPKNSGYTNSQPLGISEHFEFDLADRILPLPNQINTADFLYQSAPVDDLWNGMWGIMRAYRFPRRRLAMLPDNRLLRLRFQAAPGRAARTVTQVDAAPSPFAAGAAVTPRGELRAAPFSLENQVGINRCPEFLPVIKRFEVKAMLARDLLKNLPNGNKGIVYNEKFNLYDPTGLVFIDEADEQDIMAGRKPIEPLVLRINKGDCVEVTLKNHLPSARQLSDYASWNFLPPITPRFNFNQIRMSRRVSLHPQLLGYDVTGSDGSAIGYNQDTTVGPKKDIRYAWYAGKISYVPGGRPLEPDELRHDIEQGDKIFPLIFTPMEFGVTHLRDVGDTIKHSSHGLIGALVVEPAGATYSAVNSPDSNLVNSNAMVDVKDAGNRFLFREFVIHYQDDVTMLDGSPFRPSTNIEAIRNMKDIDDAEDSGMKAFNYKTEPLWSRLGLPPNTPLKREGTTPGLNDFDFSPTLSSLSPNRGCGTGPGGAPCGDPATPIFTATPGMAVRFRVLESAGHPRQHGYTVFGHHWNFEPWQCNSRELLNQWDCEPCGIGPAHPLCAKCNRDPQRSCCCNPFTFEVGSYSGIGPTRHLNILTVAGGQFAIPGDYLYRTQESFKFTSGMWGLFRVKPNK